MPKLFCVSQNNVAYATTFGEKDRKQSMLEVTLKERLIQIKDPFEYIRVTISSCFDLYPDDQLTVVKLRNRSVINFVTLDARMRNPKQSEHCLALPVMLRKKKKLPMYSE